jgi:cold shock CspA family protein
VKYFKQSGGFGFIVPDDKGQAEVFFHVSQVVGEEEPNPSDRVSFTIGQGKGGRTCAQQVRILA